MSERWEKMTPEEREKFREKFCEGMRGGPVPPTETEPKV
jgi:hypothetical protein